MADTGFGSFLKGFVGGGEGGGIVTFIEVFAIIIIAAAIVGGILWFIYSRKKWNLKVEFKLPRSDGRFYDAEWGKGLYDSKRGVVFLKRAGRAKIPMMPFDITKYIQGVNILTVVQTGTETYLPVLPESYDEMINEKGDKAVLIQYKTDTTKSKAWKNSFERDAKSAYSLISWIKENSTWIAIGLVIFMWGIQLFLLWGKK